MTVTNVISGTQVDVTVDDSPLFGTAATQDWDEQAFSDARGFPAAVTWHQGRLVFANAPEKPTGLWFSRSGLPFNFDDDNGGTVTDASAIHLVLDQDEITAHQASGQQRGAAYLP